MLYEKQLHKELPAPITHVFVFSRSSQDGIEVLKSFIQNAMHKIHSGTLVISSKDVNLPWQNLVSNWNRLSGTGLNNDDRY